MATIALAWSDPRDGRVGVGFDDAHFGLRQMRAEIDSACDAHPNLPDEVPPGTSFVFTQEGTTGHLLAQFKVGRTVYRNVAQRSLSALWDSVDLIDQLLHRERYRIVS